MRVGINGMGRIGRLTLRAAMGGVWRAADDPRADNRLEVVHVNELKGGADIKGVTLSNPEPVLSVRTK